MSAFKYCFHFVTHLYDEHNFGIELPSNMFEIFQREIEEKLKAALITHETMSDEISFIHDNVWGNIHVILGTGVDILDIRRFEGVVLRQGERFINRIFTTQEKEFCTKRIRVNESFAKILSIKEAVIKAISNSSGVFWHNIEVLHDKNGKPFVELKSAALSNLKFKIGGKSFVIEVSVSDELPYVCAFAIIDAL